jgi:hypothetical protein
VHRDDTRWDGNWEGRRLCFVCIYFVGTFPFLPKKKIYKNLEILLFIMTKEHKEVEQERNSLSYSKKIVIA